MRRLPCKEDIMLVKSKHLKKRRGAYADYKYESFTYYTDTPSTQVKESGAYLGYAIDTNYTGWSIPDFHRKLKAGDIIPSTPWRKWTREGSSQGTREMTFVDGESRWTEGNYSPFNEWYLKEEEVETFVPSGLDVHVQAAASKIYSHSFDALTFLAEITDVRETFTKTAKRLLSLKKTKEIKKLLKNPKALTGEWLNGRYGWRLMVYDVIDIFNLVKDWNDRRQRFSERSGTRWSQTIEEATVHTYSNRVVDVTTTTDLVVHERGSVTADIWLPPIMLNPVATAWELIPFSFVLDWFLSVGQSLEAASFEALESAYTASTGYLLEVNRTMSSSVSWFDPAVLSACRQDQYGQCEVSLRVRTPCGVSVTPRINLRINSYKVADLLSLIAQNFKWRK
jgi:hypothetical protein